MVFHMVKVAVQQTNKTDFNLGTKQELFYAQISGSLLKTRLTTFSSLSTNQSQRG